MHHSQGVCFYPGDFNPPTKYHLNECLWLQSVPEVTQVVILLGQDRPGEISQDNKAEIWKYYNSLYPIGRVNIEKSEEGNAFHHLMTILNKNPDMKCFIALDDATSRSDAANKWFSAYPNVHYQVLKNSYKKASRHMKEAADNDDISSFMRFVPTNLGQKHINKVMELSKTGIPQPEENIKEYYKKEVFNDNFWKTVVSPINPKNN